MVLIGGFLLLGPASIVGFLVCVLVFPIQLVSAKAIGRLRKRAITDTDRRVRMVAEFFGAAKLIKMYSWETAFRRQIALIRRREHHALHLSAYLLGFLASLQFVVPTMAAVVRHFPAQFPPF